MSKKFLTVLVLLVVVLTTFSLVAAQSGQLPGSGWLSGQNIQNLGTDTSSIVFTAYGTDGTAYSCGSKSAAPGAAVNFLTNVDCDSVPAGFVGSAVVSADQPIAAVVNVTNRGVGTASGHYTGTDSANVNTSIAFPLFKRDYIGRTTTFYVQNASTNPNTITATFRVGASTFPKVYPNVPANAMVVISPIDANTPAGQFGALTVTGTGPLAGTSLEHETSAPVATNMQASRAFTPNEYDDVAYCSLVRNAHTANEQTTGLQAQNVSGSPQTITVDYVYKIGNGPTQTKSVTSPVLADGEAFNFYSGHATNGIPVGALGSAKVKGDSNGNIAVVVSDRGWKTTNPLRLTTYSCAPLNSATTKVSLPQYKEFFGGNSSGLQVQNVGTSAATVTVTYYPTQPSILSPVVLSHSTPIPPNGNLIFFNVSTPQAGITTVSGVAATLFNTVGGVTITSNQPIVATVNEASFAPNPSGQDTKNYEGFNQ
jgi:hypothetical protein